MERNSAKQQRSMMGVVLRHDLRIAIVSDVSEHGELSPSCIAAKSNRPLGVVSYHFRVLAEQGVIELARREPKRGSMQNFYRLTEAGQELQHLIQDMYRETK